MLFITVGRPIKKAVIGGRLWGNGGLVLKDTALALLATACAIETASGHLTLLSGAGERDSEVTVVSKEVGEEERGVRGPRAGGPRVTAAASQDLARRGWATESGTTPPRAPRDPQTRLRV